AGMDGGQVIGLAVIFDRELPVAIDGELEAADVTGVADLTHVEIAPAFRQPRAEGFERFRVATQIDEDHVPENHVADRLQAMFGLVETGYLVDMRAADMGGCQQLPVEIVDPGV